MANEVEEEKLTYEESEEFVNPNDVVEVEVDDDVPMEEDDDHDNYDQQGTSPDTTVLTEQQTESTRSPPLPDMSYETITSHKSSSVYTVAAHFENGEFLSIVSGGGDDKAFLHIVPMNNENKTTSAPVTTTIPLEHKHTDSVSCVAMNMQYISNDLTKTPKYLAVGSYDGNIVLYDPNNGQKIHILDGPTDVEFVSFHPKGGSVLLAGSIADATVWMYHLPTSKCLQVFVGHECNAEGGGVTAGSFTPDGKFAVTVGMDGTMRIWAPRTGMCKHTFKLSTADGENSNGGAGLTCLAMNGGQDGQLVIAGGEDGNAHVVHLQGKKVVAVLPHFDTSGIVTQGEADVMKTDEEEDIVMMTSVEAVGFATKEVNCNWVATGGSNGILKVWDVTHGVGQCRHICKLPSENESSCGGITRLVWHPTMPVIFVSHADGIVRLWDARDGTLVHSLSGGSSTEDNQQINDFAAGFTSSDNGTSTAIVTAHDDGTVKVFKVDVPIALSAASQMRIT